MSAFQNLMSSDSDSDNSDSVEETNTTTSSFNPDAAVFLPPPITTTFNEMWKTTSTSSRRGRPKPRQQQQQQQQQPQRHNNNSNNYRGRGRDRGRGGNNNGRFNKSNYNKSGPRAAPLPFWTANPKGPHVTALTGTPPRLVVLVGMPGSGKSTFSAQLNQNWTIVNQDTLGGRKACEHLAEKTFAGSNSSSTTESNVCVDRCNFDRSQRKHWLDIAKKYNISVHDICAVVLDVPIQLAVDRVQKRKNHPTLKPGKESVGIVKKFQHLLKMPSLQEGFGTIVTMRPSDELAVEMSELVIDWLNNSLTEEEQNNQKKEAQTKSDSTNSHGNNSSGEVEPDAIIVQAIVDMGFSENAGKRAALSVSNAGLEQATEWIFNHIEDEDLNYSIIPGFTVLE